MLLPAAWDSSRTHTAFGWTTATDMLTYGHLQLLCWFLLLFIWFSLVFWLALWVGGGWLLLLWRGSFCCIWGALRFVCLCVMKYIFQDRISFENAKKCPQCGCVCMYSAILFKWKTFHLCCLLSSIMENYNQNWIKQGNNKKVKKKQFLIASENEDYLKLEKNGIKVKNKFVDEF